VKVWGTARIDLRQPPGLWLVLAWLAAVAWPPLPITLAVWPSQHTAAAMLRDWRYTALAAGAVGVTLILWLIDKERVREGAPRTRLGVMIRFVAYGFMFSLLAAVTVAIVIALFALLGQGDVYQRLGEMKTALIMGLAALPLALIVGVSYALWSGFAASIVAFVPRSPVRLRHALLDNDLDAPAAVMAAAPPPEPEPEPEPTGPVPETELEAAMRPDWD
jgi:hypothetical protein